MILMCCAGRLSWGRFPHSSLTGDLDFVHLSIDLCFVDLLVLNTDDALTKWIAHIASITNIDVGESIEVKRSATCNSHSLLEATLEMCSFLRPSPLPLELSVPLCGHLFLFFPEAISYCPLPKLPLLFLWPLMSWTWNSSIALIFTYVNLYISGYAPLPHAITHNTVKCDS